MCSIRPFTRQFTIEYAALFDTILPALARLGLPIPLGGTSNHFVRSKLVAAGAWDPFNVTEDADLGFRFARFGDNAAMIASTTWEEAPATWRAWLGQRTRWLKGWMQTYVVHMREPGTLLRDLGAWRFFGFQVVLGGLIFSALAHPWFYLMMLCEALAGRPVISSSGWIGWISAFILLAGYGVSMLLAALAVRHRGGLSLMRSTLWLPVYWLLISFAAYRALIDLIVRPYYWEKTPHAARDARVLPVGR